MAKVDGYKTLMHHCTKVNVEYMRLPAGIVDGYSAIASLYKRLAVQSHECSTKWLADEPCPSHEPAVDAFWWGVVAWAEAFGLSINLNQKEWETVFIDPHAEFARYLKPDGQAEPIPLVGGPPADIILRLDALWMERVVKLTGKWGWLHHLKDMPALAEVRRLDEDLRNPGSPAYRAYLESDLRFFNALFPPFPFRVGTRDKLRSWLAEAKEVL